MAELPLTKLFRKLDNPKNVEAALKEVGADFTAVQKDVFTIHNGKMIKYGSYRGVNREDNGEPLSIMKANYGLVQFTEGLNLLDNLIRTNQAEIYSAHLIDNGARLHCILKSPKFLDLGAGDRIECFFTVTTSHDGTACLQIMITPIHKASDTVFTPLGPGTIKIKHTKKVGVRLAQAQSAINKMHTFWDKYAETFGKLTRRTISDQESKDFFMMVMPEGNTEKAEKRRSNIRDKMYDIYKFTGPCRNVPHCKGTLFGAFIAAQLWAERYKTVRKSTTGRSELDAKIEARLTGDAARLKAEAYECVLKIDRMFDDE